MSMPNCVDITRMSGETEFEELVAVTDAYESLVMFERASEVLGTVDTRVGAGKFVSTRKFDLLGCPMFFS